MAPEQATTTRPVIHMQNVTAGSMSDPKVASVKDVNWTVEPGSYWVLAGLQGSGKTDFLMTAAGLIGPVSGTYLFEGERMPIFDEARLPHRLRLGLVFEGGQLFNQLTVRENVALPLNYHHNLGAFESHERVSQILEQTELLPFADTTPGGLGRNWQRRVGLARALILQPEVLLLDNPLSGLDLRHMHWWLNFLDQLNKGEGRGDEKPLTLTATTSDLRPWRGRSRSFAMLRDRHFTVLGDWAQLEGLAADLVRELLMGEPGGPTGDGA